MRFGEVTSGEDGRRLSALRVEVGVNNERIRPRSREVTEGAERAPARSMLRAVGFTDEDFGRPQIGVASSWNEVTPCNYHLNRLAGAAKEGVREAGAVPVEFTTIAVSDAITLAAVERSRAASS